MAINASIPLGVQPVQMQLPDPNSGMNALARALQIKGLQDQQTERAQSLAATNALNAAWRDATGADGSVDRNRLMSALATGGHGSKIPGLQKQFAESDEATAKLAKTKAETGKIDFDMGIQRASHVASALSNAKDQASYDLVRQSLAQTFGPQSVAGMPAQFDPAFVQTQVAQGMTIVQKLTDERARQQQAEQARHNVATERNAAGQLAVAQGNLGLRRQELEQAKNQPRGQFIETTNGYVLADPKTGSVRPVMGADGQPLRGKAADRSLNETQAKANLFGTRMQEANKTLSELEDQGVTNSGLIRNAVQGAVGLTPFIGDKLSDAAGSVINTVPGVLGGPSAAQQRVDQARRDFINAALRRESGAAIAQSEFANADRQYFPQPGDSKEVIAQKRRNRELAIRGLEAEVPGGFRRDKPQTQQGGGATGDWGGGPGKVVDFGSLK